MKSIVQEASSIAKAIEQGWTKAGQPQEFSIRILEEPVRNFLGLTTRSAKIALFFHEKPVAKAYEAPQRPPQPRPAAKPQPQPQREYREREPRERDVRDTRDRVERPTQQMAPDADQSRQSQAPRPHRFQSQWNEAMVNTSGTWLETVLKEMGRDAVTFTIEPHNLYLKIVLSEQILPEKDKEKHLLASFATLILETVKKQFKTGLRGHKVVLTHQ